MRSFVLKVGCAVLAGAVAVTSFGLLTGQAAEPAPILTRTFDALNFLGVSTGVVAHVSGGAISAEVIEEALGPTYFVKKHIGAPKYEDFVLEVGFSMGDPLWNWIASSWQSNYQRKDGAIVTYDSKLVAQSQREFFHALITETSIPAMDASSKDVGRLKFKFAPEYTRVTAGSGSYAEKTRAPADWVRSDFFVDIDGLDCSGVNKVDEFTVKQSPLTEDLGDVRDPSLEPGKLEFPNLKITLSEANAESWYAWHEDFVIKGNANEENEKDGVIELLAADGATVLARVLLFNVGIMALRTPEPVDPCNSGCPGTSASDTIGQVQAELYVERMEFQAGQLLHR